MVYTFCSMACLVLAAFSGEEVWVLDAEGDRAYVYGVPGWALLDEVVTGANPHGIAVTADGSRVFISNERLGQEQGELIWLNAATREIEGRLWVGPEPHEIECSPDGRFVYVPTAQGWQIVDIHQEKVIQNIEVKGRPHNTTLHPDGTKMFLSPLRPAKETTVLSLPDHQIVGRIPFSGAPRPAAASRDGRYLYQNVDDIHGYEVADLETGLVETAESILDPAKKDRVTRFHGMALSQDQTEAWVANLHHETVHIHRTSDHRQIHMIHTDGGPYWISMSRDGAYAFVSLPKDLNGIRKASKTLAKVGFLCVVLWLAMILISRNLRAKGAWVLGIIGLFCLLGTFGAFAYVKTAKGTVAVYDVQTRKLLTHLEAGRVPKRTLSFSPAQTTGSLATQDTNK